MTNSDNRDLSFLDDYDFSNCLVCGSCANGCPTTGAPGMDGWDARKVMRMLANGLIDEVVASNFPWLCTGCGRCTSTCPGGIDITALMGHLKSLRPRDEVPGSLHKGMVNNIETGNNLAISKEEYFEGMADLGQELAEECCPGFYVPIDKKDADILFFPNSKEVYGDFEDQFWWWKIFYAAKENWTVPGEGWEAVDWALFTGNDEGNKKLAQRKIDFMKEYNVKRMIMPDCGGGSYGCRKGMTKLAHENPDNEIGFLYLYDYLVELFEQGRIKVDKSVHAGKTFTFHDSCKHGRELARNFGKGFFDEPRWIVQQCVDDFVELTPNREKNYCCGAGGGMWPMPFEVESAWHARYKQRQIKESGANVIVVGCSNCRDQIQKRIPKHFEGCDYEVKYLWQLVAECLVIEPWDEADIKAGEEAAKAQWEKLGVDLDAEY
ncbi:(Fe-S)-binding protein [Pseudodesulfovibrio sp. zrk46]|uniref:(Fe-S)-binding protein n=1 Tax=Pseudodesulfovibrio sp. zrk46 TaxID=2725288 RepID=UPI00144A0C87|nr:(Fe-S)-binding protein [Pseudodesulfovibrio sp. zrk46]QJB57137.1 (Fe-S)-binding protein [Pseudodesulfovibrio sp. zrk46]